LKFAVLGLGKTGQAVVCFLLNQGHSVTAWDRNADKVAQISQKGIEITGLLEGTFPVPATTRIEEAVKGVRYLIVSTTADAHLPIAERLQGHLEKEQRILILNGNWGAVQFVQCLKEEIDAKGVMVAETGAQIFAAPLKAVGRCFLKSLKKTVDFGTYPSGQSRALAEELKPVFPQLHPVANVLQTTLNESNPMAHCPLDLFNLARIDSGEETLMFASSYTSPKGVDFTRHVDEERMAVMEKMGIPHSSLLELFNQAWSSDYKDLYTAFKGIKSYQSAKSPTAFTFRHFTEDIPFGILPLQQLARQYGVATPYIDAMMAVYALVLKDQEIGLGPDLSTLDLDLFR
jgi:opine dehydrogenase